MLRKFLFAVLFMGVIAPAIADTECPAGYQPVEYVELEYIESTGTQYIDTGIIVTNNNFTEFKFGGLGAWISSSTWKTDGLGYSNHSIHVGVSETNAFAYGNGRSDVRKNTITTGLDVYHRFYIDYVNRKTENDGIVENINIYQPSLTFSDTLIFFGFKGTTNNVVLYSGRKKLYQIWQNDILVRNFIPTKRVSDGAIGMFDTVTQTFFENAGTGKFIAGPEKSDKKYIADNNITCVTCPANTYKPNAGNTQCTECPENTFSPVGSTALSDCAKILHVGNYMAYMPVGRRTEHGLCTMLDGVKYCADLYEKE